MDLMMSVCDTIFVLDFGKVIAAGTPEQVQSDPAVTAAYLGADVAGDQGGADGAGGGVRADGPGGAGRAGGDE
jgi:branched-chain amino acid transport system ATP-binding protein